MLRAVLQAEKRVSREEVRKAAELKKQRDEIIAVKKRLKEQLAVLKAKLVRTTTNGCAFFCVAHFPDFFSLPFLFWRSFLLLSSFCFCGDRAAGRGGEDTGFVLL